jgi:hypothetical protein
MSIMNNDQESEQEKRFNEALNQARKMKQSGVTKRGIEAEMLRQGFESIIAYRIANRAYEQAALDQRIATQRKRTFLTIFLQLAMWVVGFFGMFIPFVRLLMSPLRATYRDQFEVHDD